MRGYDTASVRSADGTTIGYRRFGHGPAVILLHGGMQAAQNYTKLAGYLATEFTVCVPDRRGRGLSGPHGPGYSIEREVKDVQAIVTQTGATRIFGLSSGALVALRAALETPALERVALYEPPLSIHGSVNTAWMPRFDHEIASGRPAAAAVTVLKGLGVEPMFSRVPRSVLVPIVALGTRLQRGAPAGDVPIVDLIPTQHFDMRIVHDMADTLSDYVALKAQVLLLGGSKSPAFLAAALDALAGALPNMQRVTFAGLGHGGPDNDGEPDRVGATLRDFFGDADNTI